MADDVSARPEVQEFKNSLLANRSRVDDFNRLKKLAEAKGLRVFLMGGLASSYARYVSMDLKRQSTPSSGIMADRFGYLWEQIYFPTQDIDLAITRADGKTESESEIADFKKGVEALFPDIKSDVFGLKASFANRPAIFDPNSDFQKQNTDSVSNGVIELTNGNMLRDSRFSDDRFFHDLLNDRISLHLDPAHSGTEKAKKGDNPDFLSVVRLVINASRYGLKIDDTSLTQAKRVIESFKPLAASEYVKNWLLSNAKKIIQQSFDLQESFRWVREETRLASVLLKICPRDSDLHWLLTRKPLLPGQNPAPPLTFGREKTAGSMGIDLITHETKDYDTYRQIIFNYYGRLNAFLSTNGARQTARHGEGFYALKGEWGTNGGGFHIQMRLASDAVLGKDFDLFDGGIVLVYNRDKVKLTPSKWREDFANLKSLFEKTQIEPKWAPYFARSVRQWTVRMTEEQRLKILKIAGKYFLEHKLEQGFRWLLSFKEDPGLLRALQNLPAQNPKAFDRLEKLLRTRSKINSHLGHCTLMASVVALAFLHGTSICCLLTVPFMWLKIDPAYNLLLGIGLGLSDFAISALKFKKTPIMIRALEKITFWTHIPSAIRLSKRLSLKADDQKQAYDFLRSVKTTDAAYPSELSKRELRAFERCSQAIKRLGRYNDRPSKNTNS